MEPVMQLLRRINRGGQFMSLVIKWAHDLGHRVKDACTPLGQTFADRIIRRVQARAQHMLEPDHCAEFLLNPRRPHVRYFSGKVAVYPAWLVRQAKRFILTQTGFELDGADYIVACQQFEDFHMQQGRFGDWGGAEGRARGRACSGNIETIECASWWSLFGVDTPELQWCALRAMNIWSCASPMERNWAEGGHHATTADKPGAARTEEMGVGGVEEIGPRVLDEEVAAAVEEGVAAVAAVDKDVPAAAAAEGEVAAAATTEDKVAATAVVSDVAMEHNGADSTEGDDGSASTSSAIGSTGDRSPLDAEELAAAAVCDVTRLDRLVFDTRLQHPSWQRIPLVPWAPASSVWSGCTSTGGCSGADVSRVSGGLQERAPRTGDRPPPPPRPREKDPSSSPTGQGSRSPQTFGRSRICNTTPGGRDVHDTTLFGRTDIDLHSTLRVTELTARLQPGLGNRGAKTTAAREVAAAGCEPQRGCGRGLSTSTLDHALRAMTRVVHEQTPRKHEVPRPGPVPAKRGAALGESSGLKGLGMPRGSLRRRLHKPVRGLFR
ncbi:hypothetical protein CBR_g55472 [Chara braunii]|uniref:Uncharacterized protein n=1 Tax=Chara braunii TaxID=69332 RepID=A0A388K7V5_CHABU|nr:hypothetical protein CBR_g55472 [Chara braunii]|eukprot:GBG66128.1 hypothetical protein CBR_g55472 [Chara braunii]